MSSFQQVNGNSFPKKKFITTDFQKFWKQVMDNKVYFIISIIICLALAFLVNRYTTPVYMIKSTIAVKETDNSSNNPGSLLLSKDGKGQETATAPDKTQEIAILTSFPFIYKTVAALDFQITYFKEGNIGKIEIYEKLPFKVSFPDTSKLKSVVGKRFKVAFKSEGEYALTDLTAKNKNNDSVNTFKVGDSVNVNGCPIVVNTTPFYHAEPEGGHTYEFYVNDLEVLAMDIKDRLSIFSEDDKSSILEIDFTTTVPQKGIDFLNEYTKQYLKDKYEEKSRAASQALNFINEQISSIKGSLGSTENSMASFKASNTFSDAANMTNRNLDALSQLENERSSLIVNDRYYSTILNDLNDNTGLDQLVAPSSVGIQDGLTENLIRQLADMQIEKNSYSATGNSKNPLVQELDIKINSVKNTLKENVRNLSRNNKIKLSQINARASQHQANVYNIPIAEKQFTDMKRVSDFNGGQYQFLMQKRIEAGILKASATVENKVIEPAFLVSSKPLSPKTTNNYALAFLAGFVLPLSFIKLKSALNKRITGKDEIQGNTSLPIVGTIYHNLDSTPFAISSTSRTAVSESFRILRSNITYFTKDSAKKIFLITSTNSGEGKSFSSTNIALSFALAKKKTIIINLDLRVPSKIYSNLGNSNKGAATYLNEKASIKEIIQVTENPYLHYISTGELPVNPAELLMDGSKLESLFMYLRANYDYVIVDTPPLGVVADPFIIAKYADLNLIIVREKYTLKESLYELDQLYKEGKLKDVGMIINDVRLDKKGYKNAYYYTK